MVGNSKDAQGNPWLTRRVTPGPSLALARELIAQAVHELDPPVALQATCIDHAGKVTAALLESVCRQAGLDIDRMNAGPLPDDVWLEITVVDRDGVRWIHIDVQDPGDPTWDLAAEGSDTVFWTVCKFADEYGVRPGKLTGKVVRASLQLDQRSLRSDDPDKLLQ
jgi:hypothetical protein